VPCNQSQAFINEALKASNNNELLSHCKKNSISSATNIRWESVIEKLESLIYSTVNSFNPIKPKSKRVRQRAMRLAIHKKLNIIKL
jgi:hypothetical protein